MNRRLVDKLVRLQIICVDWWVRVWGMPSTRRWVNILTFVLYQVISSTWEVVELNIWIWTSHSKFDVRVGTSNAKFIVSLWVQWRRILIWLLVGSLEHLFALEFDQLSSIALSWYVEFAIINKDLALALLLRSNLISKHHIIGAAMLSNSDTSPGQVTPIFTYPSHIDFVVELIIQQLCILFGWLVYSQIVVSLQRLIRFWFGWWVPIIGFLRKSRLLRCEALWIMKTALSTVKVKQVAH